MVLIVVDHEPTVVPRYGLLSEVVGAAKFDIKAGTIVKNTYMMYALNELAETAKKDNSVPFGLLEGARIIKDIKKDQIVAYDSVALKIDSMLYHLRMLQDKVAR